MRKNQDNPADYLRYAIRAFEKLCARIDAQRENRKRIHLHVEYGHAEFLVTQAMGIRDFGVGGIAYALTDVKGSLNCHPPYRCMCAVAP